MRTCLMFHLWMEDLIGSVPTSVMWMYVFVGETALRLCLRFRETQQGIRTDTPKNPRTHIFDPMCQANPPSYSTQTVFNSLGSAETAFPGHYIWHKVRLSFPSFCSTRK